MRKISTKSNLKIIIFILGILFFCWKYFFLSRQNRRGEVTSPLPSTDKISEPYINLPTHTDFTYASHQLRTPINKALWNLEIIEDLETKEEIISKLHLIKKDLQSIHKLSSQIIKLSELEKKFVIIKEESFNLLEFIQSLLNEFKYLTESKNIKINSSNILFLAEIKTDKNILFKVLKEVLENAIIYSLDNNTVDIRVSIYEKKLLIEIENPGIGIMKEQEPLIFTKFFRGNNFDTTNIPGSGLGLYIAREYLNLLNGKVWFENKENHKVKFYIQI
jgi:signal transduction histidine kinase